MSNNPRRLRALSCPTLFQTLGLALCIVSIISGTRSSQEQSDPNPARANESSAAVQQELSRLASSSQSRVFEDPFAVTFEDYLKEAKRISSHHISSSPKDSKQAAISNEAGLIVEEEEVPREHHHDSTSIDYIFPPPRQHNAQESETERRANSSALLDEIRAMFAWDQLLTNKCSKPCGKGYKVYHLSCIDLKYRVRVEDDLCAKANLLRPKEVSEEPCNEIDCAPEWVSLEFQECSAEFNPDGSCRRNSYKREQCVMINRQGVKVDLEELKCNQINRTPAMPDERSKTSVELEQTVGQNRSQETTNVDSSSDYVFDDSEKNNILTSMSYGDSYTYESDKLGKNVAYDEPFFHVGPWSECSGAPVNKLGRRTREVACRLYLSRSSKLTDLPESSCRGLAVPDREEPCYIDSGPSTNDGSMNSTDTEENESLDETIYDSDLTRYIWKKEGWTRCTAECLGGQRESLIECWDKVAETIAPQSLCDSQARPIPTVEECNNIPCPFEWREGPFSKCTRPCGSAGIRTRPVACVRKYSHKPNFITFPEEECKHIRDTMPHKLESCNRFDCKPEWNVGAWSECSAKCGEGTRNRLVVCVQEFASRDRPLSVDKEFNPELLEAMMISAHNWHPGKVTQIPFTECYEEYRTVPALEEKCFNRCPIDAPYIDADRHQDYKITKEAMRKKTVSLKVGGKAKLVEGKNVKIRCRIHGYQSWPDRTDWSKDGVKIFANSSRLADKQYDIDDNSITANDVLSNTDDQLMADQPSIPKDSSPTKSPPPTNSRSHPQKPRAFHLRSWSHLSEPDSTRKDFYFVPNVREGRFLLVGENSLKIKKLRQDDSGIYTCSHGGLKESIEVNVLSRAEIFRENSDVYN